MRYALDTNTIIHIFLGTETVRNSRDNVIKQGAKLIIPPFVNYEILRGFLCQHAPKREAIYKKMRDNYAIGEMTTLAWEKAAQIYAELYAKRFSVKDADIIIAAFCIVNGYTLVTNNTADFENIGGLQIVDWV
ncbi:MAG: PIN domain-containing protein [Defluviitaleaceae bacterium]|nr:PIN domain-containing protein [Defluviitaleaceae bacterium]